MPEWSPTHLRKDARLPVALVAHLPLHSLLRLCRTKHNMPPGSCFSSPWSQAEQGLVSRAFWLPAEWCLDARAFLSQSTCTLARGGHGIPSRRCALTSQVNNSFPIHHVSWSTMEVSITLPAAKYDSPGHIFGSSSKANPPVGVVWLVHFQQRRELLSCFVKFEESPHLKLPHLDFFLKLSSDTVHMSLGYIIGCVMSG